MSTYDTTDRAALVALLPHLGPGEDIGPLMAFIRDRWVASLGELAAAPGFDQGRAGLIRALWPLREDADVAAALEEAAQVVRDYPRAVAAEGQPLVLTRHPAWVGLCAVELVGGPAGVDEELIDAAVGLAQAGFAAVAGSGELAAGEVLWAMAEQAEEAGWLDRAEALLARAAEAPFANAEHAVQVRFLHAIHLVEAEDPSAEERLAAVSADPDADGRTRTHAAWILAGLRDAAGDTPGARRWLHAALDGVDAEDEPDVAARIADRLEELGELDEIETA